jgi:hypothetical protein
MWPTISIGIENIWFLSYLLGARTNGLMLPQSDRMKLALNVLSMTEFTGLPLIEPDTVA